MLLMVLAPRIVLTFENAINDDTSTRAASLSSGGSIVDKILGVFEF